MKEFWVVIKETKENGCHIDEDTYTRLSSDLRNSNLVNDGTALKHFYERMIQEKAMETVVQRVVDVV